MPDFSRSSFDPEQDYSLLLAQQGRVNTDDDLNAAARILDRRMRASDFDLAGLAPIAGIGTLAAVPLTTADAFLLYPGTPAPGAATPWMLGPGRIYVDGILVENHGTQPEWDTSLEEWAGASGCEFGGQRWFPGAVLPNQGRHLVYLVCAKRVADVHLAPDLADPAFDLDTTVREQVVWAVGTLPIDGLTVSEETPDADIPPFWDLVQPSSGRLTVRTVEPPDDDEVCELPPDGAYRGRDNQFFRAEIVRAGALGGANAARLLVSRENASVRTLLLDVVDGTTARVASVGRDDVLSFRTGDVVQVLTEAEELAWTPQPDASGGTFTRVAGVDRETGLIVTADDVFTAFAGLSTAQLAAAKVRLIRWEVPDRIFDEAGVDVTSTRLLADGTIVVDAQPIRIEGGIVLEFSDAGGPGFRIGDSWSFAARYRDHSVERLTRAMPHSLHRHWTRLGIWHGEGKFEDWRRHVPQPGGGTTPPPPSDCECCEIKIRPTGQGDQHLVLDAIQKMDGRGGGVVVLCPGVWAIDEPIILSGIQNVIVRGSGPYTELRSARETFILQRCSDLRFEDFRTMTGVPASHIVVGDSSRSIHLLRIGSFTLERDGQAEGGAAVIAVNGRVQMLTVERCAIRGGTGIGPWRGTVDGVNAQEMHLVQALEVSRTRIHAGVAGIRLDATVLLADDIDVTSCTLVSGGNGIEILGAEAQSTAVSIAQNTVVAGGDGILVGGVAAMISGNEVRSSVEPDAGDRATGIRLGDSSVRFAERAARLGPATGGGAAEIRDNHVAGFVFGVRVGRRFLAVEVADNTIERAAFGIVATGRGGAVGVRANSIRHLVPAREQSAYGIVVAGGDAAEVSGNQIDGSRPGAHSGRLGEGVARAEGFVPPGILGAGAVTGGIIVASTRDVRVTENRVHNVITLPDEVIPVSDVEQLKGRSAIGIRVLGPYASVAVADNVVHPLHALQSLETGKWNGTGAEWQALVIEDADARSLFIGAGPDGGAHLAGMARGAFAEGDPRRAMFAADDAWIVENDAADREIGVHDNVLTDLVPAPTSDARRVLPLVSVVASGEGREPRYLGVVRFVGNGVRSTSPQQDVVFHCVDIEADVAAVSANTVIFGELAVRAKLAAGFGSMARAYDVPSPFPAPFTDGNPAI